MNKHTVTVVFGVLIALGTPIHCFAEMAPTPVAGDARLVTFEYDPDNTYLVLSKPRAVTHIEFPSGELIQTLAAGDTATWEITATKNRRHLFIKPQPIAEATTMTVITDQRSYQFILRPTKDGSKWYQRVTWNMPGFPQPSILIDRAQEEQLAPDSAKKTQPAPDQQIPRDEVTFNAKDLKFEYRIEGDAPFRPTAVFDNGTFTYIKMPRNLQELPVVFAVGDDGEIILVNYLVKGDDLLVQRVMKELVLKVGRKEVRAFRGVEAVEAGQRRFKNEN